jgi:hypothetical protein
MNQNEGMSGQQIQDVFSALGRIEQKIDGHTTWMAAHVLEDRKLADDIRVLQISSATQRGKATVWSMLLNGAVGIAGAVAGYFGAKGGH